MLTLLIRQQESRTPSIFTRKARSKKVKRSKMARNTSSHTSLNKEDQSLDLAMINERFSKSESSQKEINSRVGRIEEELVENKQSMAKMT
jgi:hypothetical protein